MSFDFPKPTNALVTAREHSFFRPDEFDPARLERFDVVLRGGCSTFFHLWPARADGRARGEGDGGEGMIGETVRKFGDDIRGGRRDEEQVRAIRQLDMAGTPVFLFIVETRRYRILGQRLQCQRGNEFRSRPASSRQKLRAPA